MSRIVATAPPLIHIVDLQGARDGALRADVVLRCAAVASGIPLQVSGGIRSIEAARAALDGGASRVIVGTAAWKDDDALSLFARTFGDRLLVALDVADGRVAVHGWTATSGLDVAEALSRCRDAGVVRLHVTAIERDGTMRGPDLALYQTVCASGIPVVAAGGIRDDDDVNALAEIGCEAAVMGLGYLRRLGLQFDA
jgi:phosphoribosylformimino-5-aminoimidazole carboxamide ribotide isomerase